MLLLTTFVFRPVKVEGESMYPTLHNNDIGLANIASVKDSYNYGDLVTVDLVEEKRYIVKRVVALPGDVIYSKNDVLYINDRPVDEVYLDQKYKKDWSTMYERQFTEDFDPVKVPDDCIFLLGDNRPNSRDSRSDGPYKMNHVLSNGLFIVFPFRNFGSK